MVDYEILVHGNSAYLDTGYLGLTNITLIKTDAGYILVDVGHTVNRQGLVKALADRGLEPRDITKIFLSHLHCDHVLNLGLFPSSTRVFVSRAEHEYVADPHPDDPWVPFMIREQLATYELCLLDDTGELATGVRYLPAPGHTPGCFALLLDTPHGRVVVAQDAIKFPKELVTEKVDHAFDRPDRAAATIRHLKTLGDRIIPGHYSEFFKQDGQFVWAGAMELNVRIR
jgi:glyoxylase-like metal-dependent hydrolase (beta-lactamase superfamily II)